MATSQFINLYRGESIAITFTYDATNFDPTGAVAKFVVFRSQGTADLVVTGTVTEVTDVWTVAFALTKVQTAALVYPAYRWHACLETVTDMHVVAEGDMTVKYHPTHPH